MDKKKVGARSPGLRHSPPVVSFEGAEPARTIWKRGCCVLAGPPAPALMQARLRHQHGKAICRTEEASWNS